MRRVIVNNASRSWAKPAPLARAASAQAQTRPISPHVQIYKFPVPAMVSVTNRFTGVGLSVGVSATGLLCLLGNPASLPGVIEGFKNAAPILVPVVKLIVAFPFVYHTAASVRHLVWDKTARGLDLKSVNLTSYAVVGTAVVGTVALAAYQCD